MHGLNVREEPPGWGGTASPLRGPVGHVSTWQELAKEGRSCWKITLLLFPGGSSRGLVAEPAGFCGGEAGVRLCPRELQLGGGCTRHRSSVHAGPRGLSSVAETKQPFPASDPLSPAPHQTHEAGKGGEGGVQWYICLECFPVAHPDRWGFQDLRSVA